MSFDVENTILPGARIKVIGVGGGGGNAINTMIRCNLEGVEFIAANTDLQALRSSLAPIKLQIGKELTKGLGAGADPDVGRDAALEDRHALQEALGGADMVFIAAGMGGGTGTGGASVVSQIAREMGALTVAVVTKPFDFEGRRRKKHADMGIIRLRESVDTLITIPNQRLLTVATPDLSMINAFKLADNVLVNAVRGISDIINIPGTVNVDFADVKTVMSSMGMALMGIGAASGANRAIEAARQAICSPLLEDVDIEGATGILINITAGSDVTLMEVNDACSVIQEAAHEEANIIFGAVIDEKIGDSIRVTVIATGFPSDVEDTTGVIERPRHFASGYVNRSSSRAGATANFAAPVLQSMKAPLPTHATVKPPQIREDAGRKAFEDKVVATPPKAPMPTVPERQTVMPTPPPAPAAPIISEAQELATWTFAGTDEPETTTTPVQEIEPETQSFAPATEETFEEEIPAETIQFAEEEIVETPILFHSEAPPPAAPEAKDPWADDIDRKIDEALQLVERLRQPVENKATDSDADDDLDIPAFLRNGMKDLPIG